MKSGSISLGTERIPFEVDERPARKTLGIEVHPDGKVLVLVPAGCDAALIDEKLRLRAGWISRQRSAFAKYERHTLPRRYLSGESHRYLGKQYRLRVKSCEPLAEGNSVKLTRGELVVSGPGKLEPAKVKSLLHAWYLLHARKVFEAVLASMFRHFAARGLPQPRIALREMQGRWGSLSPGGQMTLNSRLVQAPRLCIEYVITHELCHLVHRVHNAEFFALLGQLMPNWQARKKRLEEALL